MFLSELASRSHPETVRRGCRPCALQEARLAASWLAASRSARSVLRGLA